MSLCPKCDWQFDESGDQIAICPECCEEGSKEQLLELALAQFTGFGMASKGHSIHELIESMGLSKTEFDDLRSRIKPMVKTLDFQFLETYFSVDR